MKLLSAPVSPFGRKAKLTALLKGVHLDIDNVDTLPAHNPALSGHNPLAKIPVLILDDGTQIYDSSVICEYLDSLAPLPRLFPAAGPERWRALTLASLGDGIMEAALAIVYEKRYRPEDKWVLSWLDRQNGKIDQALDYLENHPPVWRDAPDYGHLTLAAALGYLDLRLDGRWRASRPHLVKWLEAYERAVPAYAKTAPPPA